ncbi:hypothetical protein BO82DRAFT_397958 [Aspergillus uvarum CBS 121591]|uniref:Jacalin-type lectin domain-containing protein n=1 Tax=Aspergillus uvarum CBS 121591 TaxID=1448315 RepID=A0A319CLZ8_9EURO|nr:hypothetical protein BO82DRAFT_397958 [Aspergillus uvarum CBS 121591]PYH86214.1 hypothetical protein BO82DRAFT_397958 [Aspergillus uvarum CBS 121591]
MSRRSPRTNPLVTLVTLVTLPPLSVGLDRYGGGEGTAFYAYSPNKFTLKTLAVWTGTVNLGSSTVLKGIKFTWFGWEDRSKSSFTFQEGETVKSLTIRAAAHVDCIKFETSQGRRFSAGGTGATAYQLGAGYITGAEGSAADEIDKLGIGLSETDSYRN